MSIDKKALKKYALKATQAMADKYFKPSIDDTKHPVVRKLEEMFSRSFHDSSTLRREMMEFASIVTGEKVEDVPAAPIRYTPLAVMVAMRNSTGHNYGIEKPFIMVSMDNRGLRVNGTMGNSLPGHKDGSLRPAKAEEISALVEAIPQTAIDDALVLYESFIS